MKPREPLRLNRENLGVDWQSPQHLQELATVATLCDLPDNSIKSITSTLSQHFSYACAGVGFLKIKTNFDIYITHVKLLRSVDVIEIINNKVLHELLQSVASVADCISRAIYNLGYHPPALGTVQSFRPSRGGATPKSCQSNSFKNLVARVNDRLSQVNGAVCSTLLGCGALAEVEDG